MDTPTYVVKRLKGRYLAVRRQPARATRCIGCIMAGAALVALGRRRRGLFGAAAFLGCAELILRGILGQNPLVCLRVPCRNAPDGPPSQTPSYQNDFAGRAPQMPADVVDEQSMESFPASDPPARHGVPFPR